MIYEPMIMSMMILIMVYGDSDVNDDSNDDGAGDEGDDDDDELRFLLLRLASDN